MDSKALTGGLIAAVSGAFLWGLLGWITEAEFGILAWAIGGLVGFGVMRSASPSANAAITAGVLALAAILGGKILAIQFALPGYAREYAEEETAGLTMSFYQELKGDAEVWAEHDASVEEFMVDRGYTEAEDLVDVDDAEVQFFHENSVPVLEELGGANPPSFAEWKEAQTEQLAAAIVDSISLGDVLPSTFGLFDILWIVLGVGTAWRMGMGGES